MFKVHLRDDVLTSIEKLTLCTSKIQPLDVCLKTFKAYMHGGWEEYMVGQAQNIQQHQTVPYLVGLWLQVMIYFPD